MAVRCRLIVGGEESRHGRGVCRACVRVADLGGEKLHGPIGGLRLGAGGGASRVIH